MVTKVQTDPALIPSVIDSDAEYSICRRLAAGGMGEVLLALRQEDSDDMTKGFVVIKRMLDEHRDNPAIQAMLYEEGRVALRMRHRNLVETFKVDAIDDQPVIVMEYLAGKSMAQILGFAKRRGLKIPLDIVLKVIHQAACGLHFAHALEDDEGKALGLIHRDVSPANILLAYDGRVKVIDFGVAKARDSQIKTLSGVLKGKVGYMSPEQAKEKKLDARSDLWSLGVVLWESLVAKRLYSKRNPIETIQAITTEDAGLPSSQRPDVTAAIDALTLDLLTIDRDERIQSGRELVMRIENIEDIPWRDADIQSFLSELFPEDSEKGVQEMKGAARVGISRQSLIGENDDAFNAEVSVAMEATLVAAVVPPLLPEGTPAPQQHAKPHASAQDDETSVVQSVPEPNAHSKHHQPLNTDTADFQVESAAAQIQQSESLLEEDTAALMARVEAEANHLKNEGALDSSNQNKLSLGSESITSDLKSEPVESLDTSDATLLSAAVPSPFPRDEINVVKSDDAPTLLEREHFVAVSKPQSKKGKASTRASDRAPALAEQSEKLLATRNDYFCWPVGTCMILASLIAAFFYVGMGHVQGASIEVQSKDTVMHNSIHPKAKYWMDTTHPAEGFIPTTQDEYIPFDRLRHQELSSIVKTKMEKPLAEIALWLSALLFGIGASLLWKSAPYVWNFAALLQRPIRLAGYFGSAFVSLLILMTLRSAINPEKSVRLSEVLKVSPQKPPPLKASATPATFMDGHEALSPEN